MDLNPTLAEALPAAPAITGLAFRHFRGAADYPAMLLVNNGSKIADGLDYDLHTLDSLTRVYDNTHNYDPAHDLLIAEVDGQMVGYSRVFWARELDNSLVCTHVGFVLPEWRGRGLGRALIGWAERRARELAAAQPDAGPVYASTTVHSGMIGLEPLIQNLGYTAVRYEFHMETPDLDHIPDVPLPPGFQVRPARPEQYHAIWRASAEAFLDHWGASEPDEAEFAGWLDHPLQQPDLWVVAWAGDEVAGSILNWINHDYNAHTGRRLGYTESITVRRPWRRRGLARALLARSMQLHKAQGMTQTALGVDTENLSGALRLYESMGYQVVSRETIYRKQL